MKEQTIWCEREEEYYEIARQRIEGAVPVQEVAQEPFNPLLAAL